MIPYRITGGPATAGVGAPDSPDNHFDWTLTFVVAVRGQELQVPVRAKLVIGSSLMDRAVEVYPPVWPVGMGNVRADELQQAVRSYIFAFLNTDDALAEYKDRGVFT